MLTDMCRSKIRKEWRLIAHTNGNGLKHKEVKISEGYRRGPGTFPDPEYSALDELASETFYREQTKPTGPGRLSNEVYINSESSCGTALNAFQGSVRREAPS